MRWGHRAFQPTLLLALGFFTVAGSHLLVDGNRGGDDFKDHQDLFHRHILQNGVKAFISLCAEGFGACIFRTTSRTSFRYHQGYRRHSLLQTQWYRQRRPMHLQRYRQSATPEATAVPIVLAKISNIKDSFGASAPTRKLSPPFLPYVEGLARGFNQKVR